MIYEVEKRAKLVPEEFERCNDFLTKKSTYLGIKDMRTFLFLNPTYLRVRLVKGNDNVDITHKQGTYEDSARVEIPLEIPYKQLEPFLKLMQVMGFRECATWNTQRTHYKYNGLKVEMSKTDNLGLILEAEGLTTKKEEVSNIEEKVRETLKMLDLTELSAKEYQKMMDQLYKKTLKPIPQHSFTI